MVLSKESRLVEVPEESPVPDVRHSLLSGTVDAKGELSAELQYENRGTSEVVWRQVFRRANQEVVEWALRIDRPYTLWSSKTETLTNSDPLDLSVPFAFGYSLKKERFLNPLEKADRIELPSLLLHKLPWSLPEKASQNDEQTEHSQPAEEEDIDLGGPAEFKDRIELEIEPIFKLHLPRPVTEENEFARYESTYETQGQRIVVRRALHIFQAKLPFSRRADLERLTKAIEMDRDQQFVVERVGELDILAFADNMSANELNKHGRRALRKRELQTARQLLEKATEKEPKHKLAWNNLGLVLLRMSQLDEAKAAFEKQIEINPRDGYAHTNLGRVLSRQGRHEEAIKAYEKQIDTNPRHRYIYDNLAAAYTQLGRWSEAETAYDKAIAIDERNALL